MPTKVTNVIGAVRAAALKVGVDSADRLSKASIQEIGEPLIENALLMNEFLKTIYNKFILSEVIDGKFNNPLAVLKKSKVQPYGDTIERMVFNPAKAISYSNKDDNILTSVPPDLKAEYIRITRKDKYPISLPRPVIQQAFLSEENFGNFMMAARNTLYNGDSIDEFLLMKKIVSDMFDKGYLCYEEAGTDSVSIAKQLTNFAKYMSFPNTMYNAYSKKYPDKKLTTWSNPENVVIIIRADKMTDIRYDVLAAAFNLTEVELHSRIIEVDGFDVDGIIGIVSDIGFWQVRDQLYELADFFRADDLSTKTYLHHWQSMTCSLLTNAMVLVEPGTAPSA